MERKHVLHCLCQGYPAAFHYFAQRSLTNIDFLACEEKKLSAFPPRPLKCVYQNMAMTFAFAPRLRKRNNKIINSRNVERYVDSALATL